MLDVRRLRLLRELAHRGTIAAVAEAMSYTPSAVSQQLSALEREAGVPLLERTGRRVELTTAARRLVEHTEAVLSILEQAEAELATATTRLTGALYIGAFPTAVQRILPAALVTLSRAHPLLELHVTELDPAEVPAALRAGTLDIALIQEYDYVPLPSEPGLDTEPFLEEPVYLAARAAEPLIAHRDSAWIAGTPGTLCHTMTVRACEAAGFIPRIRHNSDDFGTVLALVDAGQGVAFIPELAIPPESEIGTTAVELTGLSIRRRTRIAYRSGTREHPAIAAARTALHATLGTIPPVDSLG
ncbi:LysR family transcriptional regulator [Nocardia spumae]|uniref:LysR family transcriptional regulator n=1 Tax=Nocardia spumae TaxID=2887190 RepID=UPI001D14C88E|nr:LysR family transcriptional regulator [Nocardia spumae]